MYRMNEGGMVYDLKDLADLKPVDSRYFICKQCGFPNLVRENDLHDILDIRKNEKKTQIHFECQEYLAIIMKKMKANFGSYENMFLHLTNHFYKSQSDEKQLVVGQIQQIQPINNTKTLPAVPATENKGNDKLDGQGNGEVHSSTQG